MGREWNMLASFPRVDRDVESRAAQKTDADRAIARAFGREFFDGERKTGYGGYFYDPKYWRQVAVDITTHYSLHPGSKVLDVGCAKGFLLYDLTCCVPGLSVRGIDISTYAIQHAKEEMRPYLEVGDAQWLPFPDHEFDLVLSIHTLHNLEGDALEMALREVERVSRGKAFIAVDGYRTLEEREALHRWNLTARSILHVEAWKCLFEKVGYTGDYYWFIPMLDF